MLVNYSSSSEDENEVVISNRKRKRRNNSDKDVSPVRRITQGKMQVTPETRFDASEHKKSYKNNAFSQSETKPFALIQGFSCRDE